MPGGQILQNIAAVCSVSPKHLHVQALSILLVACIIQIIANTLVLEFGLQLNLFLADICLSSRDFDLEYSSWAKFTFGEFTFYSIYLVIIPQRKRIKLKTKKFSNPKLKLKQRSGRFLLDIHYKVRCKSATKVLATVGYRYCTVSFQSYSNTGAGV